MDLLVDNALYRNGVTSLTLTQASVHVQGLRFNSKNRLQKRVHTVVRECLMCCDGVFEQVVGQRFTAGSPHKDDTKNNPFTRRGCVTLKLVPPCPLRLKRM